MKTIFLIHHSHTDIGYTERQEKLMNYHRDFILQAIEILDGIHSGKIKDCDGFKWQCENHWQVENFYARAGEEDKRKFEHYVKTGEIGLSGNYLNMTELVGEDVLLSRTTKAKGYAGKIGVAIKSGMSADINGYSWGYPDALYGCGVENLYCALHPHHGMFPLYKKQRPFYWETPSGNRVLTWIGDHYHLGNEMFLCPNGGTSYTIYDDIRNEIAAGGGIISKSAQETDERELGYAVKRLTRYIRNLEAEGYPFGFFPLLVSGAITDNGPPNAKIAARVKQLNVLLDGTAYIRFATLDEFFDEVRSSGADIPFFSGDFTDWWADGVGSTPNAVKIYREAQRKLSLCSKLDPDNRYGSGGLLEAAQENMMLYAEHTWGYSSSVSEPWDSLVACLEKKKDAYATNANTSVSKNLDLVLAGLGETSIYAGKEQLYKVVNPHSFRYNGTVRLYIEFWEYMSGSQRSDRAFLRAFDEKTGAEYPCQGRYTARAYEAEVLLDLEAREEKVIRLVQCFDNESSLWNHAHVGAEGISDIVVEGTYSVMPFVVETDCFKVEFSRGKGIESILDKTSGRIITDGSCEHGAFAGIYEATNAGQLSQCEVRRRMGRNRCSVGTKRSVSQVGNIEVTENGSLSVTVKLSCTLDGTGFYDVYLKIYKNIPVLEARVCLHKQSVWNPENLYVALPFRLSGDETVYVDKTGCVLRPGIDQLPGTCQNFYLIQNGIYRQDRDSSLVIAVKDAPLVAFGKREAAPIALCDGNNVQLNKSTPYSWIMNNFWETNFKADLGGFYEFGYTVYTGCTADPEDGLKYARALNEGVAGFYIRG